MEVWPEQVQLHHGFSVCTAVPGKKEADPELDCRGVARAGTAALGYLILSFCTAVPGKKEADPEMDYGGGARAGTAAPGYLILIQLYCTWQKGGRPRAGLRRCGHSRPKGTSVCTAVPGKK